MPADRILSLVTAEIVRMCHPIRPVNAVTRIDEIPELDSMMMVEIVLQMERSLGCLVNYDRLETMDCVSDLAEAFLN